MSPRLAARAVLVLAFLAAGSLGLSAAPARAGGIINILNPAFGNGCENHYQHASARGAVATHPGSVSGNGVGVPVTGPVNQCGNADLPLGSAKHDVCNIYQSFPGFNISSGQVLNDAVDTPKEVIVQVITLLTTADITSDKPITNGSCN
ncbi:hypothetical protein GCM10027168_70880 [Streptomyces capparidis]